MRVSPHQLTHSCVLAFCLSGQPGQVDLAAEELRIAADSLGVITGAVDVEELLDIVFADFCIGK